MHHFIVIVFIFILLAYINHRKILPQIFKVFKEASKTSSSPIICQEYILFVLSVTVLLRHLFFLLLNLLVV